MRASWIILLLLFAPFAMPLAEAAPTCVPAVAISRTCADALVGADQAYACTSGHAHGRDTWCQGVTLGGEHDVAVRTPQRDAELAVDEERGRIEASTEGSVHPLVLVAYPGYGGARDARVLVDAEERHANATWAYRNWPISVGSIDASPEGFRGCYKQDTTEHHLVIACGDWTQGPQLDPGDPVKLAEAVLAPLPPVCICRPTIPIEM